MLLCCLPLLRAEGDRKREAQSLMNQDPRSDRAGELLEAAVKDNPADGEAYYLLGRWALVKGRFSRAVEAETEAARLSPGNPVAQMQAWTMVAVARDQMNESAQAEGAFQKAWTLNRRLAQFDPNAAYEYIKVLERDHREGEAAPLVAEVLRRVPGYGPAHLSRAKALAARREDAEAVREAEVALASVKDYAEAERDAHYLLARLYLRLKMPDQAERHKQWMQAHP